MPVDEVYLFKVTTGPDGNLQRQRLDSGGELLLTHGADPVGIGCHATMKGSLDPIDDMKVPEVFLA